MKSKFDLIVVGGGFAGVSAAIAAAKEKLNVLLIERYNCLGGAAVNALVTPFMPYHTKDPATGERVYLAGSVFLEIVREMNLFSGKPAESYGGEFDEEILKIVLNRLCKRYGVKLLFNSSVVSADIKDGSIDSLEIMSKGVSCRLYAERFIDATGDGELAFMSGCDFVLGREKDSLCQPMTLCFRMSGIDIEKFHKNRESINALYIDFKKRGLIKNPRENLLVFKSFNEGVLHFNSTRVIKRDPTDPFDLTEAEIEAREQVFELLSFLKENCEGFEKARIMSTALHIGIRESRKTVGEYTLTLEDIKSCSRFPDAIAVANYDIDIHNPEGAGTSHYYFGNGEWYEIPYRCLLPKGIKNLLVAGRCISSTHEAQASFRIMPFCAELGQAAGMAAAVSDKTGKSYSDIDIALLQELLRKENYII